MFALEATPLLSLQRLLPIPPLSLPLLSLQPPLPCHSLLRILPLLKRLRLPLFFCQRPLRRHPWHAGDPGSRPAPRQQLYHYCPPCGPTPHIFPFFMPSPAALLSATLSPAATPPAATPTTVLTSVAPHPAAPLSTRCTVTRRAAARCPMPPSYVVIY